MASLAQGFSQFKAMYAQLSLGKKVSFVLIFIALAATFAALVWWSGQPEYRILYTDLSAEDMNGVVTHLKDNKIKYQLGQGGTSVSVPAQDYYDVKMFMAKAGLPTGGGVGFELFDQKQLGVTDFQMKVAYLRALQGELIRTIQQISAVEACRVHLALPEETLFVQDKREATASIVVKLKANARLAEDQIQGIVFLVSSSVPGLAPQNVTVIDDKGKVLSKRTDEAAGGGGSGADDARKLSNELEQRIVGLLARSVGPEKVAAKVSVTLDNTHLEKVEEHYNPDEQVVRSEQINSDENTGSETTSAGYPGAESNLPENAAPTEGRQQQNSGKKRQETINYEIGRVTSTIKQPGGEIKKLSIAVLIDGTYKEGKKADGSAGTEFVPRTEEEMKTYTELIKNAVGFNKDRGDQIEVANIPFVTEGLGGDMKADKTQFYLQIMNYVLAGLGALAFLFFVVRPLVRWLTSEPSLEAQLGLGPGMLRGAKVGELEATLGGKPALGPGSAAGEAVSISLEDKMKKLNEQRNNILETATRDREAVTLMVRRWLKEDEGGASHA